jgi:GAF domain
MTVPHDDLQRLARFCSEFIDAFTVAVFVPQPPSILDSSSPTPAENRFATQVAKRSPTHLKPEPPQRRGFIDLAGVYSYSASLIPDARLPLGHGLFGWVAANARAVHVAPFELDSSTLGLYAEREPIRALIAAPILIKDATGEHTGVIAADTVKSTAFSKHQIRFLEEVALEIGRLLYWSGAARESVPSTGTFEVFQERAAELVTAIGRESIDLLRISVSNSRELEQSLGCRGSLQLLDQLLRLIQQTLPPHFPVVRLPGGDILALVDNMMTSFFEGKIRTVVDRVGQGPVPPRVEIIVGEASRCRQRNFDLDELCRLAVPISMTVPDRIAANGPITRKVERV